MSEATSETLLQIAKVLKSNGTEGGLLLGFRDIQPEDINLQEPVFIEFDGLPVPFFFESFKKKGNDKAIVRLTDIQSLEDAEEVVGRAVYADESSIAEYEDDGEMSLDDFIGWIIFNGDEEVGEVVDYEDIPGNPCLYVSRNREQLMIPLHEDFILGMDEESGRIKMALPEGLI